MIIIAGSCSLENRKESLKQAQLLNELNIKYQRAMLWKPRTSNKSYQGCGKEGLDILYEIHKKYENIIFVTEVMSVEHVNILEKSNLDFIYQIGTRNSQNYELLKYLGKFSGLTINYKRGMWQTIDEFIAGAYYLNPDKNCVWLCLRGIRTFDNSMRNTPDIHSILVLKEKFTYLPDKFKIIFDPSHACGYRCYVPKMALTAIAAGVDGLEIEIHSNPDKAISDAEQTICFDTFKTLLSKIKGEDNGES
jgi:3-deoxy-7-phosphoheptulonate synthase